MLSPALHQRELMKNVIDFVLTTVTDRNSYSAEEARYNLYEHLAE